MLNIVTVNWNSYDFLQLLIESIEQYTEVSYDLIVVDNSTEKQEIPRKKNVYVFPQETNIGHGAGLNLGLKESRDFPQHPYVMVVDVDCHFLCNGWHDPFLELMEDYWVVAGKGVPEKPIRPSCMCLSKDIVGDYDFRDTPGYKGHRVTPKGFDVGIQAYHQMRKDEIPIKLIESGPNRYGTLNGEEWEIDGKPLLYHHWHGTHLMERGVDFPDDDLLYDKKLLFRKIPWRAP